MASQLAKQTQLMTHIYAAPMDQTKFTHIYAQKHAIMPMKSPHVINSKKQTNKCYPRKDTEN